MARDEQSRRKLLLRTLNHPSVGGRGRLPLYALGEVPRQRSGGGGTPHAGVRARAMLAPVCHRVATRVLSPQHGRLHGEARLRDEGRRGRVQEPPETYLPSETQRAGGTRDIAAVPVTNQRQLNGANLQIAASRVS